MGKQWKQWHVFLFFLGSNITADGDCSHEVKRCLLLGRSALATLDSIMESRNITLLTKVHIVKATGFPVLMKICESWMIKKAECQRIDTFKQWCWRRLLKNPLDSKKIPTVSPKRNQSWIFIGMTVVEAESPILWPPDAKSQLIGKDVDGGKDGGQEKKAEEGSERRWDGWLASLTQWTWIWANSGIVEDRGAWQSTIHGVAESWTWLQDRTTLKNEKVIRWSWYVSLYSCWIKDQNHSLICTHKERHTNTQVEKNCNDSDQSIQSRKAL